MLTVVRNRHGYHLKSTPVFIYDLLLFQKDSSLSSSYSSFIKLYFIYFYRLKDLAKLKRYNPNLKILLSIGGWNAGSLRFSNMAASPASRLAFARSAQNFVEKYHLDGFDIDWEYPVKRGGKQVDRQNFVHLLQVNIFSHTFFYLHEVKSKLKVLSLLYFQ